MLLPLFGKIIGGLLQADPATATAFDAIQHFIDTRPLRQPAQLTSKVLLQRLSTLLSPALQGGVHILGNIPHEHVWHAYIMLSTGGVRNTEAVQNTASTTAAMAAATFRDGVADATTGTVLDLAAPLPSGSLFRSPVNARSSSPVICPATTD